MEVWPKIQVALDLQDLNKALRIAAAAYKGGAEWLEAGTLLIKSVGIESVRQLKERLPEATVVADLKTLDAGWLETEMAAQAGADVVSLSGLAHDNTIKDGVSCAREYGVRIMVDLLEVKRLLRRAKVLQSLGANYMCIHSGIDAQRNRKEEISEKIEMISKIAKAIRIPLAVAGGINVETAAEVANAGAKIIIVGRAITEATDPEAATSTIKKTIAHVIPRDI